MLKANTLKLTFFFLFVLLAPQPAKAQLSPCFESLIRVLAVSTRKVWKMKVQTKTRK